MQNGRITCAGDLSTHFIPYFRFFTYYHFVTALQNKISRISRVVLGPRVCSL